MRQHTSSRLRIFLLISMIFVSAAVATAADPLRFDEVRPEDVQGTFSLILFDNAYGNGIQRLALLDREGDQVTIEPYAPVYEYRIVKNLSGPDALKKALHFVTLPVDARSTRLVRISDSSGAVLGYELRPLFYSIAYGTDDVLEVSYRRKGEFLYVHMRLTEKVEKLFRLDNR